jgi:hypothetical protein
MGDPVPGRDVAIAGSQLYIYLEVRSKIKIGTSLYNKARLALLYKNILIIP